MLQTSAQDGMRLLEQSLAELVAAGWIGRHEAYQVARDPNIFECRLAALS